jgi:hypothetical protein
MPCSYCTEQQAYIHPNLKLADNCQAQAKEQEGHSQKIIQQKKERHGIFLQAIKVKSNRLQAPEKGRC